MEEGEFLFFRGIGRFYYRMKDLKFRAI